MVDMLCVLFCSYICVCTHYNSVELCCSYFVFFFFKQKTAYEMRISDWSSDVCSSDLTAMVSSLAKTISNLPDPCFHIRSHARVCLAMTHDNHVQIREDRKSVV